MVDEELAGTEDLVDHRAVMDDAILDDLLQLLLVLAVYGAGAIALAVPVMAAWIKWGPRG